MEITASPEGMAELLDSNQWARQLSPTDNTWLVLVVGLNTRLNKNVVRLVFDLKKGAYCGRALFGVTVSTSLLACMCCGG